MQILTVEITNYISLSKSMSLRDTLAENERAASEPLIFVMGAIAARETLTNTPLLFCFSFIIAGPKSGTASATRNSAVGLVFIESTGSHM